MGSSTTARSQSSAPGAKVLRLDTYLYARAAASVAGLDRFEERHWAEMERQLNILAPPDTDRTTEAPQEATHRGGLAASGVPRRGRQVIRSRWLR